MKNKTKFFITVQLFAFISILISSQVLQARDFDSPSLNGATGLIATPTARVGWSEGFMAVDGGMHYIGDRDDSYIPKANLYIQHKIGWELGFAYDIQQDYGNDALFHTKLNLLNDNNSCLALGGNLQSIRTTKDGDSKLYKQAYAVVTYPSDFFGWYSDTSMVIGKTWGDGIDNSNIDFSMGFDLTMLPSVFENYVHWINEFANYSYSVDPNGSNTASRGSYNSGLRLAAMVVDSRIKLNFDLACTDAFDDNRSLMAGVVLGMSF